MARRPDSTSADVKPEAPKVVKAHCNRCSGEKNHFLLMSERTTWDELIDPEHGISIDGADDYECLKCCGCDAVHMRHTSWFSEDMDENGRPVPTKKRYPSKVSRREPRWFSEFAFLSGRGGPVSALIDEVYRAIGVEAWRLATMGIRALLERIMIEKSTDTGSFKGNLDALQSAGLISAHQREQLEQVVEVGHASTHRGFAPTESDVHALLDIAENLVEVLYVTPAKAKGFAKRVPPRAKRATLKAKQTP